MLAFSSISSRPISALPDFVQIVIKKNHMFKIYIKSTQDDIGYGVANQGIEKLKKIRCKPNRR